MTLGDVCQARGSNAVPGASGGVGWQINDDDNDDQEVNDTNTDPVSPAANIPMVEGMSQRSPKPVSPVNEAVETKKADG